MRHATASPDLPQSIRVLIVNNNRMNSQLLAVALEHDQRFQPLDVVPDVRAICAGVTREKQTVVVLSAEIEGCPRRGFELARKLNKLRSGARVVMLLNSSQRNQVTEAFRAGVRGVFSRGESLKSLAKCIFCVSQGQVWAGAGELCFLLEALEEALPPRLMDARGANLLTPREQQVVRAVAQGHTNREIAQRLVLTEHTIKNYLFRIFGKLNVSRRIELVRYAYGMDNVFTVSSPANAAAQEASAPISSAQAAYL